MKKIIFLIIVVLALSGWFWAHNSKFDAEKILAQSSLKERNFKGQTVEVKAFDGKVKAYLMEEHSLPLVAVSFGFDKAGSAHEIKEGTLQLAAIVLLDGAGDYSRQELRRLMKEKGIKINFSANNDRLIFSLSYIKEFEKEAFDVLRAVLYKSHLKESDLALARQQLQVARKRLHEQPQYYMGRLVGDKFYGTHPYGRENIPEAQVFDAVSADDIRAHLKDTMGKDNLKIGIAGDISEEETAQFIEYVFNDLRDEAKINEMPEFSPDYKAEPAFKDVSFSGQSFVKLIGPGIKRLDKDFYPLYIANYVLGGSGLTSRLNKAVREDKGLTYGIYSYFINTDAVDTWRVEFSATPENAEKALAVSADAYRDFYEKGISSEELEQAKRSLLSSFNLRFSSLFHIAEMLEQMQVQKLGIDFLLKRQGMVAAVTLEDVNRAIREKMPKSLEIGQMRLFEIKGQKK